MAGKFFTRLINSIKTEHEYLRLQYEILRLNEKIEELKKVKEEFEKKEASGVYEEYVVRVVPDKNKPGKVILKVLEPKTLRGLIIFPSERYEQYFKDLFTDTVRIIGRVEIKVSKKKGTEYGVLVYSPKIEKSFIIDEIDNTQKKIDELKRKMNFYVISRVLDKFKLWNIIKKFIEIAGEEDTNKFIREVCLLYDNNEFRNVLKVLDIVAIESFPHIIDKNITYFDVYLVKDNETLHLDFGVNKNGELTSGIYEIEEMFYFDYRAIPFSSKYIIEPAPPSKEGYDYVSIYMGSLGEIAYVYGVKKSSYSFEETIEINKKLLIEKYKKAITLPF